MNYSEGENQMQFFSIILGIAYLGMGIVQISAIADGIHAWLGWDGLLAGFLAFILGYFPLIGSICGVAGAYYAWGWGLIPSIVLFFLVYTTHNSLFCRIIISKLL